MASSAAESGLSRDFTALASNEKRRLEGGSPLPPMRRSRTTALQNPCVLRAFVVSLIFPDYLRANKRAIERIALQTEC